MQHYNLKDTHPNNDASDRLINFPILHKVLTYLLLVIFLTFYL
jgi:hypothetical protein